MFNSLKLLVPELGLEPRQPGPESTALTIDRDV